MSLLGDRSPNFQPQKLNAPTCDSPTAAYIHIPFCRRRCYYCDFPISVVGDRLHGDESRAIADYVEQLCREIAITPPLGRTLETIFFGGGTPSLLSTRQLNRLLEALDHQFGIQQTAEISIEMDPGTFDLPQLQGYRAAGVNRVSLGVQAFQAQLLAACGRTHTPQDIDAAVELIHQVDLTNFSLDLISGLPHQTIEFWQASLQAAIALQPTHLSVYDLIVEPQTAFWRWYQPGKAPLPTEAMTADMYHIAQQTLTTAGYQHYEISNYARPGYHCRHNRVYWENRPFYGFGMGAASYLQAQRFTRPRNRREYFQWLQTAITTGELYANAPDTPCDRLLDTLMLGLRLAEGLSLEQLAQSFGEPTVRTILEILLPYCHQGWVEILNAQLVADWELDLAEWRSLPLTYRIRLTDPEGFLFSNVILTTLFEKLQT